MLSFEIRVNGALISAVEIVNEGIGVGGEAEAPVRLLSAEEDAEIQEAVAAGRIDFGSYAEAGKPNASEAVKPASVACEAAIDAIGPAATRDFRSAYRMGFHAGYDALAAECAAKDAQIAERNREVQHLIDTREAAYVERDGLLADNARLREEIRKLKEGRE